MKNYMGVIENRKSFHQDIPACLADITRFMKPHFACSTRCGSLPPMVPRAASWPTSVEDHRGGRR